MAALGGILISTPTIQNALFRSSSTVEQAAVNRKVQGSNPCSGAKSEFEFSPNAAWGTRSAATVQQRCSNVCRRQRRDTYGPFRFNSRLDCEPVPIQDSAGNIQDSTLRLAWDVQ